MLPFFRKGKHSGVVGIDIGSSLVKVLEVEKKGNAVYVKSIGYGETPSDSVVAKEIIDREVIASEIRNLLDDLKISRKFAITSVGGKNLIIKNFLVSPAESQELETRIVEEAQKVLPFDIETVFWDYWILPPKSGGDIPVYIVATRQETVYMIEDSLHYAGLTLGILDATPLSLINTIKFNYEIDPQKNYLVIDIGYDGSSYIIISNGLYYDHQDGDFSIKRYIDSLTKFMNIDHEEATEFLFGSEVPEEQVASFETIINGLNQSLADEIQRYISISGLEISGVFLTGGGVNIRNIEEPLKMLFEDIELTIVEPFKNVANKEEIEEKFEISDREQRLFSVVMGCALRGIEVSSETLINLSPYGRGEKKRIKIPPLVGNLVAPGVLFLATLIFIFFANKAQISTYNLLLKQEKEIQNEKKLLGDKLKILQEIDRKKTELSRKIDVIKQIAGGRAFYIEILNSINRSIPPNTWINELKEDSEGNVKRFLIDGGAFTSIEVSNFMKRLSDSKNIWNKVDLVYLKKNEIEGVGYVTFELVLYPQVKTGGMPLGPQH